MPPRFDFDQVMQMTRDNSNFEKPVPIKLAADQLGLPYWKLLRAVKAGQVPSYRFFNSRKLVRPSEVVAVMERTRMGGNGERPANPSGHRRSNLDDPVEYLTHPNAVLNALRPAGEARTSSSDKAKADQLSLPFGNERDDG
jgi:hypothetical protein